MGFGLDLGLGFHVLVNITGTGSSAAAKDSFRQKIISQNDCFLFDNCIIHHYLRRHLFISVT